MASFGRESRNAALVVLGVVLLISAGLFNRSMQRARGSLPPYGSPRLNAPLQGSENLVSASLPNGLQYYLKENSWPEKRVELRLVVNAGSVLETDEQRGLAHAVEHMLFRGTKNFPARAIDEYMQSMGMRTGQDLNAWTSRDQTVYSMTIPTDRVGALDTAIAILADMAHAATFDPNEARTEAGIVFEEWRSSRGAGARFSERRDELLLAGSKYATRDPIGDTTVLRRFDVNALRSFYNEWYRPELMALVIVGDMNADAVRKTVRKQFGSIPASKPRKTRSPIALPWTGEFRAATLEDAEATHTNISLRFRQNKQEFKTVGDYREWVIAELWHGVLNERLEDAADSPGSPLLWTDVSQEFPVQSLQVETIRANVTDDGVLRALNMLVTEIERMKQHGLTARELNNRTEAFLKDAFQRTQWNPGTEALADSYANQYTSGSVVLTRYAQYELATKIIPGITLDEVKRSAVQALSDSGALLIVTQPLGREQSAVTNDALLAELRAASKRTVAAITESPDSVVLIANPPAPGRITSETYSRDIETFDMKLSNGVRVLAKPTTWTSDDIEFRLVAPGGASLANDADYPSAYFADNLIASVGVGPVSGLKLDRLLKESSISFDETVSDEAIAMDADLAPRDLERFFQLLHLTITAPRADTSAFRRYRERALSGAAHRDADPDRVFSDTVAVLTTQHHNRAIRNSTAFLNSVQLSKSLAFWNQRMANASGFTIVITGAFQMTQLRVLLEKYVASLPAGTPEQARDDGARFPSGVVDHVMRVGVGPRARTQLNFSGPIAYTLATSEGIAAAGDLAERVLGDKLRETMGGTYGVNVSLSASLGPPSRYDLTIDFEADPDRIDSLANAAIAELTRLSSFGPTQHEFELTQSALIRDYDSTAEDNTHWADELSQHARLGWSFESIKTHQQRYKDLTITGLRLYCAEFLKPSSYVRVTMLPQTKTVPK